MAARPPAGNAKSPLTTRMSGTPSLDDTTESTTTVATDARMTTSANGIGIATVNGIVNGTATVTTETETVIVSATGTGTTAAHVMSGTIVRGSGDTGRTSTAAIRWTWMSSRLLRTSTNLTMRSGRERSGADGRYAMRT